MSKINYSFNITSFLFLLAIIVLSVTFVSKCSEYKGIKEESLEYKEFSANIDSSYRELAKDFQDTVDYYQGIVEMNKEQADKYKAYISELKRDMEAIKPKVYKTPTDSTYTFLTGLFAPQDSLKYPFADNQVKEFHIQYLENQKGKEIVKGLEVANEYLDLSLRACGEINVTLQKENELCDSMVLEMEKDFYNLVLDKDKYKKKMNNSRIVAACTALLALVVIL